MSQTVVMFSLLYLALVLGLLWAVRRKKSATPADRNAPPAPATSLGRESDRLDYLKRCGLYWGVLVRTREGQPCCPKAREILGLAYPLEQAPRLPLPGCAIDCQCHYQPLLEQRDGKRRRIHHDRRSILRYEPDKQKRRQPPPRRG